MAPSSSLTARFAIVSFLVSLVNATCYYPDGSSDSRQIACSSGGASNCCSEGFQCLSNGFCNDARYDNFERVLRGACTDKSWGSGCQQTCTSLWRQGDESVHYCSNGKACCGRGDDCCGDSSVSKFDFGSPSVIAIAGESMAQGQQQEEEKTQTTQQQQEEQPQKTQAPASSTREQQQQAPQQSSKKEDNSNNAPSATKANDQRPSEPNAPASSSSENAPSSSNIPTPNKDDETSSQANTDDPSSSSSPPTVTLVSDRTTTYASTLTSAASAPNATQNVTNNYNNTTNNTVVVAVGVGVGLLVLLILSVLGACWWLRKKRRQQQTSMRAQKANGKGDVGTEYFEIEGSEAANEMSAGAGMKGPWGRGSGVVFEMEGSRGIELEGAGHVAEIGRRDAGRGWRRHL